jgi:hypothetical protein
MATIALIAASGRKVFDMVLPNGGPYKIDEFELSKQEQKGVNGSVGEYIPYIEYLFKCVETHDLLNPDGTLKNRLATFEDADGGVSSLILGDFVETRFIIGKKYFVRFYEYRGTTNKS